MDTILKDMEDRFGQLIALIWVFLNKLVPLNLTVAQVQALIKEKEHPFWQAFEKCLDTLRAPSDIPVGWTPEAYAKAIPQIKWWQEFYRKHFNIELDLLCFSYVPPPQNGFNWLVIVAKGITLDAVYEMCRTQFGASKYWDESLDVAIIKNDRDPVNGTYAVWFRERVEADKETKNLSSNQLKEQNVKGITLLERLLLELKYFSDTKNHLDIENWTLCSGSRFSDGDVPSVYWNPTHGELQVDWSYVDSRHDSLRSRVAVTL